MAVEQTGLEFIAENIDNFLSATGDAANAVTGFSDVGQIAAAAYGGVEEIITGALRHIGEIAVDSLLQAGDAIKQFATDSISEALDAENNIASLNATIKASSSAVDEFVSVSDLSSKEVDKLNKKHEDLTKIIEKENNKINDLTAKSGDHSAAIKTEQDKLLDYQSQLDKVNSSLSNNETHLVNVSSQSDITSKYAQELAMKFRDLAKGSDDAVISIEEVAIRAGTISKDELPDFIKHTFDLAQVMGSAEAAATLLARSEEDPVAAMGKAQRAGIVFTQTLKDQIKQLQKDGKLKEANALFTERLAEATGGMAAAAAETTSGKWAILTGHFKEAEETIGSALIPGLNLLFDNVLKPAMPLIDSFASSIANLITMMMTGDFKGGIFGLQEDDPFIGFLFTLRDVGVGVFNWIMSTAIPTLQSFGETAFKTFGMFLESMQNFQGDAVGGIADFLYKMGLDDFGDTLIKIANWITGTGIPAFYALSDWFMNVALPAIQPVVDALGDIFKAFQDNNPDEFTAAMDKLFAAFNGLWEKYLQPALTGMWNKFSTWIVEQAGIIEQEFNQHWRPAIVDWLDKVTPPFLDKLGEFIGAGIAWLLTTGIPNFVGKLIDGIQYMLGLKQPDIEEAGSSFFSGLARGFSADAGWAKIRETIDQLKVIIVVGLERASEAAVAIVNGIGLVIGASLQHMSDGLKDYVDGFYWAGADLAKGIADGIRDAAGAIYDALSGAVQSAIDNVLNVFDMHSPSLVTANIIGSPLAEGIAEGIMSSMKSVRSALGEGIVSSVATVSQMMGGGGSSYSSSNSWNLNVSSNQNSQGIIQDFSIMQTMAV